MQALILNNFVSRYKNRGIFDEKEIIDSLPPRLRLKVAVAQYYVHVRSLPFFTGMDYECLATVCSVIEHLDVSKETEIYEEGDMGATCRVYYPHEWKLRRILSLEGTPWHSKSSPTNAKLQGWPKLC